MLRRPLRALLVGAVLAASACAANDATSSPAASPAASPTAGSPAPASTEPSLTPVPNGSPSPADSGRGPGTVTQTETEWGPIWDALPASFPRFPGSAPTDPIGEPVSGSFAIPAGPEEAAEFMQSALELAGYSTEALSGPFEDGSYVIDSVGPTTLDCRVQTRLTPLSGTTRMTVLYGTGCPIE